MSSAVVKSLEATGVSVDEVRFVVPHLNWRNRRNLNRIALDVLGLSDIPVVRVSRLVNQIVISTPPKFRYRVLSRESGGSRRLP